MTLDDYCRAFTEAAVGELDWEDYVGEVRYLERVNLPTSSPVIVHAFSGASAEEYNTLGVVVSTLAARRLTGLNQETFAAVMFAYHRRNYAA